MKNKVKFYKFITENEDCSARVCVKGMVERKRSKGRPKMRWIDDLKNILGVNTMFEVNKIVLNTTEV